MNGETLIEWYNRVMSYAKDHYDEGGWDYFVETVERKEFDAVCKLYNLTSYNAALLHFKNMCSALREREDELRGWASW